MSSPETCFPLARSVCFWPAGCSIGLPKRYRWEGVRSTIALTERAGDVVSYGELISLAWPNVTVDESNLRVQIATIRKALSDGERGACYISNVTVAAIASSRPFRVRPSG